MMNAKQMQDLIDGKGYEAKTPFVGLGSFDLTLTRIKMKRDKGQTMMHQGKVIEVPGKPTAYIVEGIVDRSTNPTLHPVGSSVAAWLLVSGKYEEQDVANACKFVGAFYKSIGEPFADEADFWVKVLGVFGSEFLSKCTPDFTVKYGANATPFDEGTVRGCRIALTTNMPKPNDKDGNPKKKVPTPEGFLYKNWAPIAQTVEQMLARRAELDKTA